MNINIVLTKSTKMKVNYDPVRCTVISYIKCTFILRNCNLPVFEVTHCTMFVYIVEH
jgi:hypothetical protein